MLRFRLSLALRSAMFLLALLALSCSRDPNALAQKHLAQGAAYMQSQDYAKAIIEFRNAVKAKPRDGKVRLQLAEAYLKIGDAASAVREFARAADLAPDDVQVQLRAGDALLVTGQFDRAREIADTLLKKDERNVAAQILRGYALAGLKDVPTAITQLQEAMAEDASQIGYINIGELYLSQGQYESAEAAFKEAIKLDTSNVSARLALANLYWSTRRSSEARRALDDTLALNPDDVLANRSMAVFLLGSGEIEAAEQYLKRAAQRSKTFAESYYLSDYYTAMARFGDARAVLEPIATREKPPLEAVLRLAELDYALGRKEQAHSAINAILKQNGKHPLALSLKARLLVADGRAREALAAATAATELGPNVFAAHYSRGLALGALRDLAEATTAFNEALRLRPRSFDVHVQLSRLYLAQGHTNLAEQFARSALAIQPGNRNGHRMLAQALFARRDLTAAEVETRLLLQQHPDWSQSHMQQGYLQMGRGDTAGALGAFQRALALDPKANDALRMVTLLAVGNKKNSEAWRLFNERLSEEPNNPELLVLAADLHAAENDKVREEEALLKLLQVAPNRLDAYGRLGHMYVSQRRLDEARRRFEELATQSPKSAAAPTMIGYIHELQQNTNEAKKAYERALVVDSRAAIAANNLAWLYTVEGTKLDEAVQLAQTAKQEMPDEAAVDDTLAMAYYKKELPQLGIPILLEGIKKQPKNAVFQYHLGLAYAKAGDDKRARAALQQALTLQADFDGANDARRVLATLP